MRKLGKRRLTLALQQPLAALPARACRTGRSSSRTAGIGSSTASTPTPRTPACRAAAAARRARHRLQGPRNQPRARSRTFSSAWWSARHERRSSTSTASGRSTASRWRARVRTIWQSVATPVITTSLYFVVFGGAIGSRMQQVGGVSYGAFIVPGLIMLSLLTQSISNASFGIYLPKFTGTIYEMLSAPVSRSEAVARLCRRGGDQIGAARPDHPGDGDALRAGPHPASRAGWWRSCC